MSEFALHLPLNGVSFGQVSTALLREFHQRGVQPFLFTVGQSDLSAQEITPDFNKWIESGIKKSFEGYTRDIPIFKLWHLNHESLTSYAQEQTLFTFYELDHPTSIEVNIAQNQKNIKNQDYLKGKIVFNLTGKLEKRKHHKKIIRAWLKKYGNQKDYVLQCAIANPFIKEEDFKMRIGDILDGKTYFNINFLGLMQKNSLYNDFLNSGNIIIGMSGAEGWGLPEFQSIALGKYGVILNATAYKEWANEKNCVLVEPNGKEEAADGVFFKTGGAFNQGNIHTFDEEEFIEGCEKAIKRYKENPQNSEGIKLQEDFTYAKTVDSIMEVMNA